jgi:hypothetical protein
MMLGLVAETSCSAIRIGHAHMAAKRTSEKAKSGQVFGQRRNRRGNGPLEILVAQSYQF